MMPPTLMWWKVATLHFLSTVAQAIRPTIIITTYSSPTIPFPIRSLTTFCSPSIIDMLWSSTCLSSPSMHSSCTKTSTSSSTSTIPSTRHEFPLLFSTVRPLRSHYKLGIIFFSLFLYSLFLSSIQSSISLFINRVSFLFLLLTCLFLVLKIQFSSSLLLEDIKATIQQQYIPSNPFKTQYRLSFQFNP